MSESPLPSGSANRPDVRVWDPFVRVFHWSLIVLFAAAYVSEGEPLWLHAWAGYGVAALLASRLVWGFVGPRHARFADFVRGPAAVMADLKDHLRGRAKRYLGHNPAGGAMIVALMLCLAATAFTGMATLADGKNEGPLAPWLGHPQAAAATAAPTAAGEPRERERHIRSPYREVHEFLANLTLVLAGFHLAGVVFSSVVHRENLARAMITGRKRADPGAGA